MKLEDAVVYLLLAPLAFSGILLGLLIFAGQFVWRTAQRTAQRTHALAVAAFESSREKST